MSDGLDVIGPEEGHGGTPEGLSEKAKERFAGTAAALRQVQREEKKIKRHDSGVAKTIAQFLTDEQQQHLSILIARITARNCPSSFILAILSLINDECLKRIHEYIEDVGVKSEKIIEDASMSLQKEITVFHASRDNGLLINWITRLQIVLSFEKDAILNALLLDEKNMDSTILQLTTFVLKEFFKSKTVSTSYKRIQPLATSILQTVFQPYIPIKKD